MRIAEQNLKNTCQHIVSAYRFKRFTHDQAVHSLNGLSLLLVGYREKRHVEKASSEIAEIYRQRSMAPAARSLKSAEPEKEKDCSPGVGFNDSPKGKGAALAQPVDAVGQGGNHA